MGRDLKSRFALGVILGGVSFLAVAFLSGKAKRVHTLCIHPKYKSVVNVTLAGTRFAANLNQVGCCASVLGAIREKRELEMKFVSSVSLDISMLANVTGDYSVG